MERHGETRRDLERCRLTGTRLERDPSIQKGTTDRDTGRNPQREGDGERDTDKYMNNRETDRETDSEIHTSPTVHRTRVTDACTDTDRVAGGHLENGGHG